MKNPGIEIEIGIKPYVDTATAELCLKVVEIYLNQNQGTVIECEQQQNGNKAYRLKKVWSDNE